jgi:hypothetical protein
MKKTIAAVLLLLFILFPLAVHVWAQSSGVYKVEIIHTTGTETPLSGDVVGFSCMPHELSSFPDCYVLLRKH